MTRNQIENTEALPTKDIVGMLLVAILGIKSIIWIGQKAHESEHNDVSVIDEGHESRYRKKLQSNLLIQEPECLRG